VHGKTASDRIGPQSQRIELAPAGRRRHLALWRRKPRKRPVLALAASGGAPPPGWQPRRARSIPGAAWLAVVPVGALLVALTVYTYQTVHTTAPPRVVVASLPYWDIGYGTSTVLANRQDVNEVSPWMYGLGGNGQIFLDSGVAPSLMTRYLGQLHAKGLPIVPTLANIDTQGNWSYQPAAAILHNQAQMRQHVAAIVALVQRENYAGIDIDYEELHAADRDVFTAFLAALAAALHAQGKILSVALFAKTTNAGYAPRNIAQDYRAIGRVADQVRLMGYDYHWSTSPPGPVAPIGWIREVLRYAKTQISAAKIVLGVPLYGYDWSNGHGSSVTWLQALRLSRQHRITPHYDTAAQAPWFSYTDSAGHKHTVWFENAESSKAKFGAAQGAGIGGVYLWMYGYVDTGTWPALRQALPIGKQKAVPAPREAS
jgi:spore germination protein